MSFAGRVIVVTRPRGLAQALAEGIERRGARAFLFPALDIQPLPAPPMRRSTGDFDLVV